MDLNERFLITRRKKGLARTTRDSTATYVFLILALCKFQFAGKELWLNATAQQSEDKSHYDHHEIQQPELGYIYS